ncbi:hypothetical protein KY312_01380 [Candidatus Woesearchaeota archaeon]|nr:hypothetical protein [Candidatus Woesearchaeota archaeon]
MVLGFTRDTILGTLGLKLPVPLLELIDIVIISLALGYIFKDFFKAPTPTDYDPLVHYKNQKKNDFKFALLVTAPAVVLHELGHKLVAMSFGVTSQLYASYGFLLLGIIIRIMNFPFLFFVPGFVSHAPASMGVSTLISFAGPFVNLVLWIGSKMILKFVKLDTKYRSILIVSSKVNMFLFFFNMIPVPPFDGAAIWNIFKLF